VIPIQSNAVRISQQPEDGWDQVCWGYTGTIIELMMMIMYRNGSDD
jgi:hypothetical protein